MPFHVGAMGKHQGQAGGKGNREHVSKSLYCDLLKLKKMGEAGKAGLAPACLNHLSKLWGISCLW